MREVIQIGDTLKVAVFHFLTRSYATRTNVLSDSRILTINIAGLRVGCKAGELWARACRIGNDVISLQEALTGRCFDREAPFAVLVKAFEGDPSHGCMGRSAPARFVRTLDDEAERQGLELPALHELPATLV